ncbi:hypothetical protein RJT34_06651 [Clitoria ternatea]|uniref:Transmembrane protein n=1 Tax=Clitoria ternatea TaxID=43366 RepID=A0AAN9PTN3_CLITE
MKKKTLKQSSHFRFPVLPPFPIRFRQFPSRFSTLRRSGFLLRRDFLLSGARVFFSGVLVSPLFFLQILHCTGNRD